MKRHVSLSLLMVAVLGLQTIPVVASQYAMQTLQQGRDLVSGGVKYVATYKDKASELADQVRFGGITLKQAAKYLVALTLGAITIGVATVLIKKNMKDRKSVSIPRYIITDEALQQAGVEDPTLMERDLVSTFGGGIKKELEEINAQIQQIDKITAQIQQSKFKDINLQALQAAKNVATSIFARERAQSLIDSYQKLKSK